MPTRGRERAVNGGTLRAPPFLGAVVGSALLLLESSAEAAPFEHARWLRERHQSQVGPGPLIVYERGEPPRDVAIVAADTGEECFIERPGDDRNPSRATTAFDVPE